MEILTSGIDEELTRFLKGFSALVATAKNIKLEDNLQRFSLLIANVKDIHLQLQSQQAAQLEHGFTGSILQRLDTEVKMACKVVEDFNSASHLRRLVSSPSVLSKLNQSAKDMATTLHLLPVTTNATAAAVIHELKTIEFKLAADAEAILFDIQRSISENGRGSYATAEQLLHLIADATGSSGNISHFRSQMELLKKVKVELEDNKQHNEAYQLSQLIQLLENSATASPSPRASTDEEDIASSHSSFLHSFDGELLVDPVSVSCGHSFERRTIEEHLRLGNYRCPECNKELPPTEKLTPNNALRSYILEKKLRDAAAELSSEDLESVNRALEDLKDAMTEIPSFIAKAKEHKLVPVLALHLKKSSGDTRAVLRCLLLIAHFSDENKETMGTTGVIRCLTKLLRGTEPEPDALEILLELSKKEAIADKIGNDPNTIPTLVSLLNSPSPDMAEMARGVLENLSKIDFTFTMGKCGYFSPFLDRFCQAGNSEETRALMAKELTRMKLTEIAARSLENDQFIASLIELLDCGSPSSKLASLQCIKHLMAFSDFRARFLWNECAIPALLGLMTAAPGQQCKQEMVEILVLLIQTNQPTDHESNPKLQFLYSCESIKALLEQFETSGYLHQVSLLQLLHLLVQKSDEAREWIRSKDSAMRCLFSALKGDQNDSVRLHVLKLIYYIAGGHPNGIALPPSPAKDSMVNSLIAILTYSCVEEEMSAAAGIIGCLPIGDHSIDEMLRKSSVLKAINDMFSLKIKSNELLENALTTLQRYVVISNSETRMQVRKLHPHLVQMLSNGSPLAKQRAAMILSHLARCNSTPTTSVNSSSSLLQIRRIRIPEMIQMSKRALCPVHRSSCSLQAAICLIKAGAVKPLVEMVRTMELGASVEALMTLNTVYIECDSTAAADAIVESGGAAAIIEVLQRGPLSVKEAALELFQKIYKHPRIKREELDKFKRVLVYLHSKENTVKIKAASLRAEIGLMSGPS